MVLSEPLVAQLSNRTATATRVCLNCIFQRSDQRNHTILAKAL